MILARMLATDEDALVCDLAETYQIYDYRQLSPLRVAVFSCGLRADSRIMPEMTSQAVPIDTLLLAQIVDVVNLLFWAKTKNGMKGLNRPRSVSQAILNGTSRKSEADGVAFTSGEDFEKERQRILTQGGDA
ncbi:unknown phage protein [Lacticaseibacillus rhamnosus MTCC 5462]|nr:unknown phage protein [Lacticaseibacillus rhamnosus MTCC 5462]